MTKTELIDILKIHYDEPDNNGCKASAIFSFSAFLQMFLIDLKKFDNNQIAEFDKGDLIPYDDTISAVEQEIVYLELQR
jgi:hypothetical protein